MYVIEKIKKFKKWSEFYELWTKLIDDLPIWKKTKKEEKVIDPLDVSGAPDITYFTHSFTCETEEQYTPIFYWFSEFQPKIFHKPSSYCVYNSEDKLIIKTTRFDSLIAVGYRLPKITKFTAIYYSKTYKEFIYIYNFIDYSYTIGIMNHNGSSGALVEFLNEVNNWTKIQQENLSLRIQDVSISKILYKIKLNPGKNGYEKKAKLVSRSFNGLFFEQKDILLEYLRKFKEGTLYPKHLREDNKLGILMYGPPGTGKSACMCAISEFLQRDLMPVDGSVMRSRSNMDRIFTCTDVVIAFDEFDCLLDVVGKRGEEREVDDDEKQSRREINTHSHKADMAAKLFTAALEEKDDAKKAQMMAEYDKLSNSSTDKVDMAYLLSKFQGYESAEGRCVVGSTNNPHLIDDALKRKGRFDLVLHLDNATPKMILDIVNYYYQTGADEVAELEEAFMDLLPLRVISPACVQDMAMNCSSARETLERLIPKRR